MLASLASLDPAACDWRAKTQRILYVSSFAPGAVNPFLIPPTAPIGLWRDARGQDGESAPSVDGAGGTEVRKKSGVCLRVHVWRALDEVPEDAPRPARSAYWTRRFEWRCRG